MENWEKLPDFRVLSHFYSIFTPLSPVASISPDFLRSHREPSFHISIKTENKKIPSCPPRGEQRAFLPWHERVGGRRATNYAEMGAPLFTT